MNPVLANRTGSQDQISDTMSKFRSLPLVGLRKSEGQMQILTGPGICRRTKFHSSDRQTLLCPFPFPRLNNCLSHFHQNGASLYYFLWLVHRQNFRQIYPPILISPARGTLQADAL